MIDFVVEKDFILLEYQSERDTNYWVIKKLEDVGQVTLKGTFYFSKSDLYLSNGDFGEIDSDEPLKFVFAHQAGEYYKIDGRILSTNLSLFIHKEVKLSEKFFTAIKNISIFKKIDEIVNEDIYIGGEYVKAIPESDFIQLLKKFPNRYEVEKYVRARLGSILMNYFDSAVDTEKIYNSYMNKKVSKKGLDLSSYFKESELSKYKTILQKLEGMIESEISYTEKQWQIEILQIILLLHPKYIRAFPEAPIRDTYNKKNRSLDFLLVDSSGSVDVAEIKRPFDTCIVTQGRYRDNYIPIRELSGTVMQIEKYIFYLNKWGKKGEDVLTAKYKDNLPDNFKIKITNPSGIIIMGRENNLSTLQREDFEVIKRKYKNIIDIVTYDDLLKRLRFTIGQLQKET